MSKLSADVLFCDDIRQETSGKFLFVGVYPGDLIPQTIPAAFPLALFLRVYGLPPGRHGFLVSVTYPDGSLFFKQQDEIDAAPNNTVALIFGGLQAVINTPGDLEASIEIAGKKIPAGHLRILHPPSAP